MLIYFALLLIAGLALTAGLVITVHDDEARAYMQVYGQCTPGRICTTAEPCKVAAPKPARKPAPVVMVSHENRGRWWTRYCRDYQAAQERFVKELLTVRQPAEVRRQE